MSRYEITLDPNYVADWGIWESIRELRQNAIDQATLNPLNASSYKIIENSDDNTFDMEISSKLSELSPKTLLMGYSDKREESKAIGQFGEGYKLACLTLARLGYKVKILNYQRREVWTPKIVNSRKFGSDLLVFDTSSFIFSSPPNSNLTFQVSGLPIESLEEITNKDLEIYADRVNEVDSIFTNSGLVLTDDKFKRQIFVNNLWVSTLKDTSMRYGYSFNPGELSIGRDRNLVSDFDIFWVTSSMWGQRPQDSRCADLIVSDAADTRYLTSQTVNQTDPIVPSISAKFHQTHGIKAIPVSDGDDVTTLQEQYPTLNPVVVPSQVKQLVMQSDVVQAKMVKAKVKTKVKTPKEILSSFLSKYDVDMTDEMHSEFTRILEMSEDWMDKQTSKRVSPENRTEAFPF